MTLDADGAQAVRADDITLIAKDVWSSFLTIELEPADVPGAGAIPRQPAGDDTVTGVVEVTDAWQGSVEVSCGRSGARGAAAAMLGIRPAEVTESDVEDVLGELANMVGGNVKSLLPAPSRLCLPTVRHGCRPVDGATLVSRVGLVDPLTGDAVQVSVWRR